MATVETLALDPTTPGTTRHLHVHRYGRPGARPKVYIQAGTHADELPANLLACHLRQRFDDLDAAGAIDGEIVLVPLANPIGLEQVMLGDHQGRYHLPTGANFNRAWPRVAEEVAAAVTARLGDDVDANTALVHGEIAQHLARCTPANAADALHLKLMTIAQDADIVLDLHTDSTAELHLYLDPGQWPHASDLAAWLAATVVMLARDSGDNPFEETQAAPYIAVNAAAGRMAVREPLSVVVELRGERDVDDALADADATAIINFLTHRGVLAGETPPPPRFTGIAADFSACEIITAPAGGIVVYKKNLGDTVAAGDVIAEIVDPLAPPASARTPVTARQCGRLFALRGQRLAWPGSHLGKIHGDKPLPGAGRLYD